MPNPGYILFLNIFNTSVVFFIIFIQVFLYLSLFIAAIWACCITSLCWLYNWLNSFCIFSICCCNIVIRSSSIILLDRLRDYSFPYNNYGAYEDWVFSDFVFLIVRTLFELPSITTLFTLFVAMSQKIQFVYYLFRDTFFQGQLIIIYSLGSIGFWERLQLLSDDLIVWLIQHILFGGHLI